MKIPARVCVEGGVKTILRPVVACVLAAVGLSSCAEYPYVADYGGGYAGDSSWGGYPPVANNIAPWLATGVAVAALAGYANERDHRHDRKDAAWFYHNRGYPRYGHCHRPPPRPCW